ncbi:hypothetical protein [Mycobacterium sp. OTB74]|uniref:hypothetical protein n=1 Tax=Mycobacterium sp. OTB74 TaxID=1853452 RepID=UPI0024737E3B|nr:hypothetical protein [Mycobacterium sp. OTB74]MDH6242525.1 hypothetical protein [Mycobacterium sp. OTB74]
MCAHDEVYLNGQCKTCDRERNDKYRQRRKLAMALLHSAEARGLSGTEAIAALQNIGYWELQECVSAGIKPL